MCTNLKLTGVCDVAPSDVGGGFFLVEPLGGLLDGSARGGYRSEACLT